MLSEKLEKYGIFPANRTVFAAPAGERKKEKGKNWKKQMGKLCERIKKFINLYEPWLKQQKSTMKVNSS